MSIEKNKALKSVIKIIFVLSFIVGIVVGILMLNDNIPYDSCSAWDGGIPGGYCDAPNYTTLGTFIFFLAPISLLAFIVSGAAILITSPKGKKKN